MSHIVGMRRPTNFKVDIRMDTMTPITDMRSDLKGRSHRAALGGCSNHHLQGGGAYYGGRTTGGTA